MKRHFYDLERKNLEAWAACARALLQGTKVEDLFSVPGVKEAYSEQHLSEESYKEAAVFWVFSKACDAILTINDELKYPRTTGLTVISDVISASRSVSGQNRSDGFDPVKARRHDNSVLKDSALIHNIRPFLVNEFMAIQKGCIEAGIDYYEGIPESKRPKSDYKCASLLVKAIFE